MILTQDNYYTPEADMEYMSCSQYQGWQECEAKQLAKLQGRWVDEPSQAFLVGNFFHSYFEGEDAHAKFKRENLDIFTKSSVKKYNSMCEAVALQRAMGIVSDKNPEEELQLLAPYEQALKMIEVAEKDPLIKQFIDMQGQNEIFMTGEICGTKWRMKMDKYIPDTRFIIDYKTVANIWETSYNPIKQVRQTFVEMYGYLFRAAVYSLVECQNSLMVDHEGELKKMTFNEAFAQLKNGELNLPQFFLICVSKQDYPDKEILFVNHEQQYIAEIESIPKNLFRFNMIKEGRTLPKRCGGCDYCRATKILEKVIPYYELSPEFRSEREYDKIEGMAETLQA